MHTIAILGGGASGMAAALAARERLDVRVMLLERQSRVGRKLLATGNGRCNLTNIYAGPDRYHGGDPDFIGPAMLRFAPAEALEWFYSLGLITRTEPSGRVYPGSDTAASVVDTLRLAMDARGVETLCSFTAEDAHVEGGRFVVTSSLGDTVECDRLIVACGGLAGAKLGGTRAGYALLTGLGHACTALRPSLVQLKTDHTYTRPLRGVRTRAVLTLERGGETLARSEGEVQFADYGLTGPAALDLSRAAGAAGEGAVVALRFLPELTEADVRAYLREKQESFPNYRVEHLLAGALHNSITRALLRRAQIPPDARLWALSEAVMEELASLLCRFTLPLTGTLGFDEAQVTAGGARTDEFDPETMESLLVPGLYACGEVLDIDGDCGGFNLQWAWASGRLAGLSASASR